MAVFSDVDFISDLLAYSNSFFGPIVVGDNSALLFNVIDDLSGSSDLIAIRSRGNFKRPFIKIDEIERQAEEETAQEVTQLNAQIAGLQSELQSILTQAKGNQEVVIDSSIKAQHDIQLKIREAQQQLNEVKLNKRKRIEHLGNIFEVLNMLTAPAVILLIAVVLGIYRSVKKRHYISHASDA